MNNQCGASHHGHQTPNLCHRYLPKPPKIPKSPIINQSRSPLAPLHLSRTLYKSHLFMQNKPNFHPGKNKPNPIYKKGLRKFYTPSDNEKRTQNEPKTNPISEKPKMNLNFYWTKDYDNNPRLQAPANEPKTNPIQTQFHLPQTSLLAYSPCDMQSCPEGSRRDEIRHTKYVIRHTKYKPTPPARKLRCLLTTLLTNRMVPKMAIISAMSKAPAHPG